MPIGARNVFLRPKAAQATEEPVVSETKTIEDAGGEKEANLRTRLRLVAPLLKARWEAERALSEVLGR